MTACAQSKILRFYGSSGLHTPNNSARHTSKPPKRQIDCVQLTVFSSGGERGTTYKKSEMSCKTFEYISGGLFDLYTVLRGQHESSEHSTKDSSIERLCVDAFGSNIVQHPNIQPTPALRTQPANSDPHKSRSTTVSFNSTAWFQLCLTVIEIIASQELSDQPQ